MHVLHKTFPYTEAFIKRCVIHCFLLAFYTIEVVSDYTNISPYRFLINRSNNSDSNYSPFITGLFLH